MVKMINHIVLFKRRPEVNRQLQLEGSLVQCIRELESKVPTIRRWKVSANELRRPI